MSGDDLLLKCFADHADEEMIDQGRGNDRDSGLVHALLGLADKEAVLGHPVAGLSWEGMAIEIKRSLAPKLERGFHSALDDLEPERSFTIYLGSERYRLVPSTEAIGLAELCAELEAAP